MDREVIGPRGEPTNVFFLFLNDHVVKVPSTTDFLLLSTCIRQVSYCSGQWLAERGITAQSSENE